MTIARKITAEDILPRDAYAAMRASRRKEMAALKRNRRVAIGPDATAYFESFETMRHQVQEMLHIEGGGAEQLPDELEAYNPLVPDGRELVCTVMFEIDDPVRRKAFLAKLGGVEETMFIRVGDIEITGQAEEDVDRTSASGKASSVQFIHFPFTDAAVAAFRKPGAEILLGFKHPAYGHMARLTEEVRTALAGDFAA